MRQSNCEVINSMDIVVFSGSASACVTFCETVNKVTPGHLWQHQQDRGIGKIRSALTSHAAAIKLHAEGIDRMHPMEREGRIMEMSRLWGDYGYLLDANEAGLIQTW